MDNSLLKKLDFQEHFELAFNCPVCLCPKLRMVYGYCQHKVCIDCLYDNDGLRNVALDRCPVCMQDEAFPLTMPDIPKDNELLMYQAGVRKCKFGNCKEEFWHWEMESHEQEHKTPLKTMKKKRIYSECNVNNEDNATRGKESTLCTEKESKKYEFEGNIENKAADVTRFTRSMQRKLRANSKSR